MTHPFSISVRLTSFEHMSSSSLPAVLAVLILLQALTRIASELTKVLVPASYKEWMETKPAWITDPNIMKEYGYTTFLYQKYDPALPNYVASNRGCENSIYYKYIIDHYDSFPDIAVFVHSKPEVHIPNSYKNWLDVLKCISPNATYMSLNFDKKICREFFNGHWASFGIWLEQCMRDALKVIWDLEPTDTAGLNLRLPPQRQLSVCTHCCQQFFVSRAMIHKRPLKFWKDVWQMLGNQSRCHFGEPDYENLYAFNRSSRTEVGPEPQYINGRHHYNHIQDNGLFTQALVGEHLAHMIFGGHDLNMKFDQETYCQNYLPQSQCPGSPCIG